MKNKKIIGKYLLEAFVGLIIFVVCLRVFLIPIFFFKGSLPQLIVVTFSVLFSVLVTYKAVRYIHRYL